MKPINKFTKLFWQIVIVVSLASILAIISLLGNSCVSLCDTICPPPPLTGKEQAVVGDAAIVIDAIEAADTAVEIAREKITKNIEQGNIAEAQIIIDDTLDLCTDNFENCKEEIKKLSKEYEKQTDRYARALRRPSWIKAILIASGFGIVTFGVGFVVGKFV